MKNKKLIGVFSVVAGVILIACVSAFLFWDTLYFYFAPELYTLETLSSFYADTQNEILSYKKAVFKDKNYFDGNFSFSFWKYKDEKPKREDFSFDFSIDYENKKAEFAADNNKAKKIEDIFVYLYDNEIGTNFADFSDDYWVNSADTLISDYNKSDLRKLHKKDELKEKNLSFDALFSKKEKKSVKESFVEFSENIKLYDKKINKNGDYTAYFWVNTDYFFDRIYCLDEIKEYLTEKAEISLIVSLKNKRITSFDIDTSDKVSFFVKFNGNSGYFTDFEFSAVSPVAPFYVVDIKSENKLSDGGFYNKTDFNYVSDTTENAKKIKFINDITLSENKAHGKLKLNEKEYNYSGSFYNKDAFSIDITDFDLTE